MPVIVKKSSPKNLLANCRSTVGRQLTDRLPTANQQVTDRLRKKENCGKHDHAGSLKELEATCRRRLRSYLPVMANLQREGKLLPLKFDERFYVE